MNRPDLTDICTEMALIGADSEDTYRILSRILSRSFDSLLLYHIDEDDEGEGFLLYLRGNTLHTPSPAEDEAVLRFVEEMIEEVFSFSSTLQPVFDRYKSLNYDTASVVFNLAMFVKFEEKSNG